MNTPAAIEKSSPVSVVDIENTAGVACEHADAMATMFKTIARLTSDPEIQGLCFHGALLANLQGNDIDGLRERALDVGLVGGAA